MPIPLRKLAAFGVASLAAVALYDRLRPLPSWRGKVVLLTGGSRGLGLALARELSSLDCTLALCARDEQELAEARAELEREGARVSTHVCDVGVREEVTAMVREVTALHGRIDVLINNAGVIRVAPIEDTSIGDLERSLDTMFWGVVHPTMAVLPQMEARRQGNVVTITSLGAEIAPPHLTAYSAAKFAARGFSEGLRAELRRKGVVVTTILPGLMRTGSHMAAEFKGDQAAEMRWFSVAATMPILSMSAARAAASIVTAARRGEAIRVLSLPAKVGAFLHGVAPGLVQSMLGMTARWLPAPRGEPTAPARTGAEVEPEIESPAYDLATFLGTEARLRYHQSPKR